MGPATAMTTRYQWTTSPLRVSWAVAPATRRLDGTPAAPAHLLNRGGSHGRAAAVGRGTNGLSAKLSQGNGLDAEASSQGPPDPRRSAGRKTGGTAGRPAPPVRLAELDTPVEE